MERVWDYPRPPAVEPCDRRVRVEIGGELVADSTDALRVLETSHPPTIYIPPHDVVDGWLVRSHSRTSWCEFKGRAHYFYAVDRPDSAPVAWSYRAPSPGYETLKDYVAFYPGRVDAAYIGDERVQAQEGDFYGGWVTSDLVGPFKGAPGTLGW